MATQILVINGMNLHHVKNSESQTAVFSLIITEIEQSVRGISGPSFLIFLPMYISFYLEGQFIQSFNLHCCCQLKFLLLLIVVVDFALAQIHSEQLVVNNYSGRTLPFICDTR